MSRVILGIISGIVFGLVSVGTMLPLKMEDKKRAVIAAFVHRFALGFVICNASLPWPPWASGLALGTLLSVSDAIITKAYAPIIGLGAAGGLIIGIIAG